ncbi:MAG TPA: glycosyltransferase family 2 protein [Terriglobales bacterium]|nr:glycosyltransferase family 2 protein [Terriglobales bacterium]
MSATSQPLVSIITPVYNGAQFLSECIESVLAQTYQNWEYTIVNNCSTDESLAIAQEYAAKDPRIHVINNDRFLQIIENHNHAIRQICPESKYCKFVFADDWLYPSCIEEMVELAENNPSVGLVGAYTMDGQSVIWQGPSYSAHQVSGRDVCRSRLLGGPYVFGTMTSLLLRSDLVRKRKVFFNEQNLHADQEACFDVLRESDFGFVHQVLSFSRPREQSNGSFAKQFESLELGNFVIFLKYGPMFLEESEYRQRVRQVRREYHRALAKNVLRIRPKQFWKYHRDSLAAFDGRINRWLLTTEVFAELYSHISDPVEAIRRCRRWWLR